MSKKKKSKKSVKSETPFDFGLDAEQKLADMLCDRYLHDEEGPEAIDDAFIGAFNALSHRMLTIFKKEFVLEIVEEMAKLAAEDGDVPYVCKDCQEEHGEVAKTTGLTVVQGKGTV